MNKEILILGAGFGGLETAFSLSKHLPAASYSITLIDKEDYFSFGFSKLDIMFGRRSENEVKLFFKNLLPVGINFIKDTVTNINPDNKIVKTTGSEFSFDYLIIALGADLKKDAIPGFKEAGHEFYSLDGALKLSNVLKTFESGKILISIFSKPYKCPPAPYEAAFLLHEFYAKKGIRNKIDISVVIPSPIPIPVSTTVSGEIESMLSEKNIGLIKNFKITHVDQSAKQVFKEDGTGINFDLLIGIPVHIPPKALENSAFGNSWIGVNKNNLETNYKDIYAVGDVTSIPAGQFEVPKAGTLALDGAEVIVNDILNKEEIFPYKINFRAFGTCYFETGNGEAGRINADFLSNAEPKITIDPPSSEFIKDKNEFEKEYRNRWFSLKS